jgi:hypothetical protein
VDCDDVATRGARWRMGCGQSRFINSANSIEGIIYEAANEPGWRVAGPNREYERCLNPSRRGCSRVGRRRNFGCPQHHSAGYVRYLASGQQIQQYIYCRFFPQKAVIMERISKSVSFFLSPLAWPREEAYNKGIPMHWRVKTSATTITFPYRLLIRGEIESVHGK